MLQNEDNYIDEGECAGLVLEKRYKPGHKVMYAYSTDDGIKYKVTIIRGSGAVYFIDDNGYFIPKANIVAN